MPREKRCVENSLQKSRVHFPWQAQYLVKLECHFSWQAQNVVTFWEIAGTRNDLRMFSRWNVKSNLGSILSVCVP